MDYTIAQIAKALGADFDGDGEFKIVSAAEPVDANHNSLALAMNEKYLEDLKNAIMAYGRAKDQAKAAKFIAKRAKALGAEDLIPDSEDFQKSLKEVATQVPAKTIAIDSEEDED